MYCSKCGKEIPAGIGYCPNCGQKINDNKKPKTKINTKIYCAGLAAAVVIIALLIFVREEQHTIDLDRCLKISYSGNSGQGSVEVTIDADMLKEEADGKMKFDQEKCEQIYDGKRLKHADREIVSALWNNKIGMTDRKAVEIVATDLSLRAQGELNRSEQLQNGDVVEWEWHLDSRMKKTIETIMGCRIRTRNKKFELDGFPELLKSAADLTDEQMDELTSEFQSEMEEWIKENWNSLFLDGNTDYEVSYAGNLFYSGLAPYSINSEIKSIEIGPDELDQSWTPRNQMMIFLKVVCKNPEDFVPRYCYAGTFENVKKEPNGSISYEQCEFPQEGENTYYRSFIQPYFRKSISDLEEYIQETLSQWNDEEIQKSIQEAGMSTDDFAHFEINIDSL